jgi:hypothetical protein
MIAEAAAAADITFLKGNYVTVEEGSQPSEKVQEEIEAERLKKLALLSDWIGAGRIIPMIASC